MFFDGSRTYFLLGSMRLFYYLHVANSIFKDKVDDKADFTSSSIFK
jgi:hypothetical protein